MSTSLKIPYHALVLVADGHKALLLSNEGDEKFPNLRVKETIEAPVNPSTAAQGADRPGRTFHSGQRSAVGQTDWHRAAEDQFARQVVDRLFANQKLNVLILVAPPAFLAELRKQLPDQAKAAVVAEIDKDLTHLTVREIERNLTGL